MNTNNYQSLFEFVDIAENNRNYPSNTAMGIKAALKLYGQELNQEEKDSLEIFKQRFDKIYQSVFLKNKSKMSAGSLETYKRRIKGVLKDYEAYGTDPNKLASWSRKPRNRKAKDKSTNINEEAIPSIDKVSTAQLSLNRLEITLRPGVKAILLLPSDLTMEESEKVKKYIDAGLPLGKE